jgi:hypothetical protein
VKGRRGRTGALLLVSMLLIPLLSREVGKNIRVRGRKGRTGALFLVSMLLLPSMNP